MLPLLPALILLILQGPTNIERMALDGRLPAALNAIHRQMESGSDRGTVLKADGVALVSLLAMSGDPQFSQALVRLLAIGDADVADSEQPRSPARETVAEDLSDPPPCPLRLGSLSDGFFLSQRSRDGPALRA